MDKPQRKMNDTGKEYRKEILDKERTNLMSRIIRKSRGIDVTEWCHCQRGISSVEWHIQADWGY